MEGNVRPLTTGDVAQYCGVSRMGVIRWIGQGKLKAYTTPGGHYRIQVADFRDFLEEFDIPVAAFFFGEEAKRILVVAEDASALGAIVRALSAMSEGYEMDIALDGASAVAKMADFKPAVVILDTMASGTNVPELAQWVKENLAGRRMPALLLTTPANHETEGKQLTSAFSSMGAKQPLVQQVTLETEALQQAIRRLLAV